jgi:dTDP-4-dehydrorhamnose 3,5-epimerase
LEIIKEILPDTFLIKCQKNDDVRGTFSKTYHKPELLKLGIDFDIEEEFYSISKKNVLRGMHFQVPPHDHKKIVFCLMGSVLDVLLDLRPGPSYGKVVSINLSAVIPNLLIIPSGIAHGFLSLANDSLLLYKTTVGYQPSHDMGIRWDTFYFDWGVGNPILSLRDRSHPPFLDFVSPF